MQTISVPQILPEFAQVFVAAVDGVTGPLPDRLRNATAQRRREYSSGRYCAAQALRNLGAPNWDIEIGTGTAGEPLWPDGYTGSITHTGEIAMSAVARTGRALSLGIDTEGIVDPARGQRISRVVLHACETRLKATGFDAATVFTLVFSAKESLFKCVYPLVKRRFDYRDAAIRTIDVARQVIAVELLTDLGTGYERGRLLSGHFTVDATGVTTAFWVPNDGN